MNHYLKSISFLLQQQTGKFKPSSTTRTKLKIKSQTMIVDVYSPTGTSCGTLLFIHGMSLKGFEDPRQVNVCRALAGVGFTVIAPNFLEIKDTTITAASIDKIEQIIMAALKMQELCPQGRLGIFAPSFSAALALRAAARPTIREHISVIACIGTFAHVDTVVHFLLTEPNCDEYARLIILKNFIEFSIGKNAAVKKALEVKIADNWHKRPDEEKQLPQFLKKLNATERKLVENLIHDQKESVKHFKKFLPKIKDLSDSVNPSLSAEDLKCAVLLAHGEADNVIPANESLLLYELYRKTGVETKLLLTPYISHGDSSISLKKIPDLLRLIAAFAWFFRRV